MPNTHEARAGRDSEPNAAMASQLQSTENRLSSLESAVLPVVASVAARDLKYPAPVRPGLMVVVGNAVHVSTPGGWRVISDETAQPQMRMAWYQGGVVGLGGAQWGTYGPAQITNAIPGRYLMIGSLGAVGGNMWAALRTWSEPQGYGSQEVIAGLNTSIRTVPVLHRAVQFNGGDLHAYLDFGYSGSNCRSDWAQISVFGPMPV